MNDIISTWPHPAPHGAIDNHPWGLCVYHSQRRLCFVFIPKNASTTFKRIALQANWSYSNYQDIDSDVDRYVVILRDPVDRLISTTNMFLTEPRVAKQTVLVPGKFYTEDCHYEKQIKFLKGLNHSKVDFYYYNPSVLQAINYDYNLEFGEIPHVHRSKKLITTVDIEWVKLIYKQDYDLINSVYFRNGFSTEK